MIKHATIYTPKTIFNLDLSPYINASFYKHSTRTLRKSKMITRCIHTVTDKYTSRCVETSNYRRHNRGSQCPSSPVTESSPNRADRAVSFPTCCSTCCCPLCSLLPCASPAAAAFVRLAFSPCSQPSVGRTLQWARRSRLAWPKLATR